jgi:cytochrome c oxidase subunit III
MAQAVDDLKHGHTEKKPWFFHEHFTDVEQQFDTAKLGMWTFLATEILMFGGLFVAYAIMFSMYPEAFKKGHEFLNVNLGIVNTAVLIFSSLTMALAVRSAQTSNKRGLVINLMITIACAFVFLIVKYFEYSHKIHEGTLPGIYYTFHEYVPHIEMYFALYFMMTGLHGIHVTVGIGLLTWILLNAMKGKYNAAYYTQVEMVGLYWHLVDLVWIYLFPLLYLVS